MKTTLISIEPVKFYWEQYKIFKTYDVGTKFTLIRYTDSLQPTSVKVVAPGGLIGTICIKNLGKLKVKIINE